MQYGNFEVSATDLLVVEMAVDVANSHTAVVVAPFILHLPGTMLSTPPFFPSFSDGSCWDVLANLRPGFHEINVSEPRVFAGAMGN